MMITDIQKLSDGDLNHLTIENTNHFNDLETQVFQSIISDFSTNKIEQTIYNYSEIVNSVKPKDALQFIMKVNDKILGTILTFTEPNCGTIKAPVFSKCHTDPNTLIMTINLNPTFISIREGKGILEITSKYKDNYEKKL